MQSISDTVKEVVRLSKVPMKSEQETGRVEIIMLVFKQPDVEVAAIGRVVRHTKWPYKLTVYDNRPNTANTSRIWNKLINDSTCDYVLIMDSDAYVQEYDPCWLTRMMESIDETGIVIPVSDSPGGAHQQVSVVEPYPSHTINSDIWSGYCFLVDKKVFKKFGTFDERFYIYGQDSEWASRTSKPGAVMRKDTLVRHLGGASFKEDPLREADKLYARELFKRMTT